MTQTVLITGATAGFGWVTAEKLVKHGFKVIATGRRTEKLHQLSSKLGGNLFPLPLDMRDETAITQLF